MDRLDLYNKVRAVPKEAQKEIRGGRLKGMTDINPMWRIKALTENFGACGTGWYYNIEDMWTNTFPDRNEVIANVRISLYVNDGYDNWSQPIIGIGGSMMVSNEKNGVYVNDEAFKMALTDAISVACKALGFGADIYWSADNTKYNDIKRDNNADVANQPISADNIKLLNKLIDETSTDEAAFLKYFGIATLSQMKLKDYKKALVMLEKKRG